MYPTGVSDTDLAHLEGDSWLSPQAIEDDWHKDADPLFEEWMEWMDEEGNWEEPFWLEEEKAILYAA